MAFIGYMTTFSRIGWLEYIDSLVCKCQNILNRLQKASQVISYSLPKPLVIHFRSLLHPAKQIKLGRKEEEPSNNIQPFSQLFKIAMRGDPLLLLEGGIELAS